MNFLSKKINPSCFSIIIKKILIITPINNNNY